MIVITLLSVATLLLLLASFYDVPAARVSMGWMGVVFIALALIAGRFS